MSRERGGGDDCVWLGFIRREGLFCFLIWNKIDMMRLIFY